MSSVAGVAYTYDGDGKRVQKSNGKLYWYGMSSDALLETDLAGNNATEFIFFGGKRVVRRDSAGTVSYFFSDHLGSASVVTNASGTTIEEESDYYPWGRERVITDTLPDQNYKFTGKERDAESDLDYFVARQYSCRVGRFLSVDPFNPITDIEEDEDTEDERLKFKEYLSQPQNWNRYGYAVNNPLVFGDEDGNLPVALVPILTAGAALASSPAGQRAIQLASRYAPTVGRAIITQGQAISTAVFRLGPVVRGQTIEILRGASQAFQRFPVIDKFNFSQGIATSIKSLDVFAKSYQNMNALASRLTGFVDKLASFSGGQAPGVQIRAGQVAARVLEVIIPKGQLSPQQVQVLWRVLDYAKRKGAQVTFLQAR